MQTENMKKIRALKSIVLLTPTLVLKVPFMYRFFLFEKLLPGSHNRLPGLDLRQSSVVC